MIKYEIIINRHKNEKIEKEILTFESKEKFMDFLKEMDSYSDLIFYIRKKIIRSFIYRTNTLRYHTHYYYREEALSNNV